jgi:hypothetical protein
MLFVEIAHAIFYVIWIGLGQCKSVSHFLVRVRAYSYFQWNRCQKSTWTRSSSVFTNCGKVGFSYTTLQRWFSVCPQPRAFRCASHSILLRVMGLQRSLRSQLLCSPRGDLGGVFRTYPVSWIPSYRTRPNILCSYFPLILCLYCSCSSPR